MPITTQNWDGVTAPSVVITGWTVGSNWVTETPIFRSSPNGISIPKTVTTETFLTYNTADTNSGNVQVVTNYYLGVASLDRGFRVFGHLRGSATPLNASSTTQYSWSLLLDDDAGVYDLQVYKQITGVRTAIGSVVHLSGNPTTGWYQFVFTAVGTTLSVAVIRASDGNYLNSSGSFAATVVNAISFTDSAVTGAGYVGMSAFSNNASQGTPVYTDDFSFDTAGGGAATPYPRPFILRVPFGSFPQLQM